MMIGRSLTWTIRTTKNRKQMRTAIRKSDSDGNFLSVENKDGGLTGNDNAVILFV